MKIIKLTAENIKKLRAVSITPQGNVIQITGPNGAGKSSVLDCIYYALAGASTIPSKPVREGEEKAFIKLDLGDVVVTRKFTAAGGTSLVVEAASGARFPTPQKMLDEITKGIAFDPLAFTRMAPKAQLETLKGLVKLDVDVDAIDGANARDFEKRTEVNREVARLKAQISGMVIPETAKEDLELDESSILREMEEAATHNRAWEKREASRQGYERSIHDQKARVEEAEKNLRHHQATLKELEAEFAAFPPPTEQIDLSQLRMKAERARKVGEARRLLTQRDQWASQLGEAVTKADDLTQAMNERLKAKESAIASAKMPVERLTFGEGEVIFNGVPFSQASQAEQLVVSTVIAMALNPKLRVIRIQDGSLLDAHNLELIGKLAEKGDYQVWIERVESGDACAIHMKDGAVVGSQAYGAPPKEAEVEVAK